MNLFETPCTWLLTRHRALPPPALDNKSVQDGFIHQRQFIMTLPYFLFFSPKKLGRVEQKKTGIHMLQAPMTPSTLSTYYCQEQRQKIKKEWRKKKKRCVKILKTLKIYYRVSQKRRNPSPLLFRVTMLLSFWSQHSTHSSVLCLEGGAVLGCASQLLGSWTHQLYFFLCFWQ